MSLTLLDFFADWCGPCQMMKPTIDEFKNIHPEVKVVPINIDVEDGLAEKYEVSTIPCLVLERDGEEVTRLIGVQSLKRLEEMLEK